MEVGEEVIEEAAEDGEIEETVVVICPPTTVGRMTVLTIVTTEAAEIAVMEDAVVEERGAEVKGSDSVRAPYNLPLCLQCNRPTDQSCEMFV